MRSDSAAEQLYRSKSAEALVWRLFNPPPLSEADVMAMFADEEVGRQAWAALSATGRYGTARIVPVEMEEGSFLVEEDGRRFLLRVTQGPEDYQIVFFAEQPQP